VLAMFPALLPRVHAQRSRPEDLQPLHRPVLAAPVQRERPRAAHRGAAPRRPRAVPLLLARQALRRRRRHLLLRGGRGWRWARASATPTCTQELPASCSSSCGSPSTPAGAPRQTAPEALGVVEHLAGHCCRRKPGRSESATNASFSREAVTTTATGTSSSHGSGPRPRATKNGKPAARSASRRLLQGGHTPRSSCVRCRPP
jgi:hypothetical protein